MCQSLITPGFNLVKWREKREEKAEIWRSSSSSIKLVFFFLIEPFSSFSFSFFFYFGSPTEKTDGRDGARL